MNYKISRSNKKEIEKSYESERIIQIFKEMRLYLIPYIVYEVYIFSINHTFNEFKIENIINIARICLLGSLYIFMLLYK